LLVIEEGRVANTLVFVELKIDSGMPFIVTVGIAVPK
jgi:hypothetical protein